MADGIRADESTVPALGPIYAPQGQEPTTALWAGFNTRRRFSAALDIASGRVVWTVRSTMDVRGLCQFLTAVRGAYPRETVVLAWDNWPVHQHPDVVGWAAALGIELLWLPTYAPWTNPIEQLWRWLKQTVLHSHRLAHDWPTLLGQVTTFLAQFAQGAPDLLRYVGALPH